MSQEGDIVRSGAKTSGAEEHQGTFTTSRYAVLRDLVPAPAQSFLYQYALKSAQNGQLGLDDVGVPGTPYRYGDAFMETLLEMLVPRVEVESGLRLFPTYSYFRVYQRDDVLHRHQDRPACEVSLTVNLGYKADEAWPIWIEVDDAAKSVLLEPGDAMLYRGIDVPHWRDRFAGEHSVQVFLHYVNQDGAHADWRYDKRPTLGTSPLTARVMEQFRGVLNRADRSQTNSRS